jgi:hypothetical protein
MAGSQERSLRSLKLLIVVRGEQPVETLPSQLIPLVESALKTDIERRLSDVFA